MWSLTPPLVLSRHGTLSQRLGGPEEAVRDRCWVQAGDWPEHVHGGHHLGTLTVFLFLFSSSFLGKNRTIVKRHVE